MYYQMDYIQAYSDRLIKEIEDYQKVRSDQVMDFVTELTGRRAEADDVTRRITDFLRDIHVKDLIKEQEEKKDLISQANNVNLGTCEWKKQALCIGMHFASSASLLFIVIP